jgi:hypothetical protein
MPEDRDTEELRAEQLTRELEEQARAHAAPRDDEAAQHERRADKAHYLRQKLDERAASEREDERDEDDRRPAG